MRIFSKLLALLLAFLIGFVACIGAIVGVGFFIYSKVSVDFINELGFVSIDTSEKINKDEAEVQLTSLTIADLVAEVEELKALGDEATIDLLIDRYGLIISEELEPFINEDMRKIPIFQIGKGEGTNQMLKALTIGNILGYDKESNPDYTLGSDESEFIWYNAGEEVVGVNAFLADYSIYKLLNEGVDTTVLTDDLTIGELLRLECKENLPVFTEVDGAKVKLTDIEPIKVWYNDDGTRTDKIIASVAGSSFANVGITFEELEIADVIGYVEYKGAYYSWDVKTEGGEHILLTPEDGLTTEFASLSIKDVSNGGLDDKVSEIELAKVLDYHLGEDGKYYHNGTEVTGIMAVLADEKVGNIGESVGLIKVGEVAGYTYHDGVWYSVYDESDASLNVEAAGILAAMADMTVDEMSDESALSAKIRTVKVADVLAYELREDGKYYENSETTEPIKGIMAVVAGTPVNNISDKLNNSEMGELMGFTKTTAPVIGEDGFTVVGYEDVWLDESGTKVHVLMQSVARTQFKDVDKLTDDLTIADLIEKDDRQSGFISLVPEDTNINNIGSTVGDIFNEKTIGDFITSDAIRFKNAEDAQILIDNGFGNYTIPELIEYIIYIDLKAPVHP